MIEKRLSTIEIIPLVRSSQASHLFLLSGLCSSDQNMSSEEFHDLLTNGNELAFTYDFFSVFNPSLYPESIWNFSNHTLILDPCDILNNREFLIKFLKSGGSIRCVLSRSLTVIEEERLVEFFYQSEKFSFLFVGNKKSCLNSFSTEISDLFAERLFVTFLPKLNHWDVLLEPIEVIASMDSAAYMKYKQLIFFNKQLKKSTSRERKFYLRPSKQEYMKISSSKTLRYLADGGGVFLNLIKSFIQTKIFLVRTFKRKNEIGPIFLNITKNIYWKIYRLFGDLRAGGISSVWGLRSFWNAILGVSKAKGICTYWVLHRSASKIKWTLYHAVTSSVGVIHCLYVNLKWKVIGLGRSLYWRVIGLSRFLYWRVGNLFIVAQAIARRCFWALIHSPLLWPLKKVYWFAEYQVNKRILGRTKNEN